MKRITINVGGREYPCYPTLGAMLRFRNATGREVTTIDMASIGDLAVYLHCCTASASAREKIPFDIELQEFSDSLVPSDLSAWSAAIAGGDSGTAASGDGDGGDDEKKSL